MSAATTTILGIAAIGAKVGTDIYSGHKAAAASKEAAAQQQAGVQEARAYGEPLYQQALQIAQQQAAQGQAGLAPYTQQGTQGLYALSDFLGVPRAPAPATAGAAPLAPGAVPVNVAGASAAPGVVPAPLPLGVAGRAAKAAEVARATGAPTPPTTAPATSATQSSYVTLRAPTGQTQPVPADQVAYYLARGATRV